MQRLEIVLSWIIMGLLVHGFWPMSEAFTQNVPPGITYVTAAQHWAQAGVTTSLVGCPTGVNCSPQTLTLTSGPAGVDTTSGAGYQIYICEGTNCSGPTSEAVMVTGGTCKVAGGSSCTVTFMPYYNHPASNSYIVESASSGIQEAINLACGVNSTTNANTQCNVTIPANGPYVCNPKCNFTKHSLNDYNIFGTVFLHTNQSILDGTGASLNCKGRGPCLQIGDLANSNHYTNNTVKGVSFRSPTNYSTNSSYSGVNITNVSFASGVATITTASTHGFHPGDMVTILFTDSSSYWGDAAVTTVPSSTTFTYNHPGSPPSQVTPGVVALAYTAVLDNGAGSHLSDIQYDLSGENGAFNNFFDLWDDENCTINHFSNNGISLNANSHWTGSFVFSGGQLNIGHNLAPVITLRDSSITANFSNGVTVYNSNGLYVENTVIQASSLWQIYVTNATGNYQGAFVKNLYSESSIALNPTSPAKTPFAGTGIGGMIAGPLSGAANLIIEGQNPLGAFQSGGTGRTSVVYFVVAHDTTTGQYTSPMQVLNWMTTGSDTPVVKWPRVANGKDHMVYDVIRSYMTPNVYGVSHYPAVSNCPGGMPSVCGSIVLSLSQATACSGGLVCSYTDTGIDDNTTAYVGHTANYNGNLNFWPGTLVAEGAQFHTSVDPYNVVNVGIGAVPIVIADLCHGNGTAGSYGYTQCLGSSSPTIANNPAQLLLDIGVRGPSVSKGKLNFQTSPYVNSIKPHHIITLIDSNPGLTQSTLGFRPAAAATDVWIGTDVPPAGVTFTSGQLALGAPVAIHTYINNTGETGTGWMESLTSSLKEFNVASKFDSTVAVTGHLNQNTTGNWAGTCTMSTSTICTINLAAAYANTPGCIVTVQSATVIAGGCIVSGTTVTVSAASSNSLTWAAFIFGNPN